MAKKKAGTANPTRLPVTDGEGNIQVVIETPRGSRNKYAFDPEQRMFQLKKVLPEGMAFPHDFGFVPSTKADDGDPVDVLILMDEPAFPGCLLKARLIGIIEGIQSEDGKKERNDRLLAVAASSHTHSDVKSIDDLNQSMLKELEKFLVNYHLNDGEKFKVLACKGPQAAAKHLKQKKR